jgi:dipeptidyl aminopeptidase/acylaminoacyl peptidase
MASFSRGQYAASERRAAVFPPTAASAPVDSDPPRCVTLRRSIFFPSYILLRSLFMKLAWFVSLVCASVAASSTWSVPQSATSQRAITIDDLFKIREVSDPQISWDGQAIAYTVKSSSLRDDKTEERVWMVPSAGGEPSPMTSEGVSSSHSRWSPDGKFLAFLSDRNEGKTQIWLLSRSGGEAQRITDTPQDVDNFVWSPDSRRLVAVLRDPTPEELDAAAGRKQERPDFSNQSESATTKTRKHKTQGPWVIDRLQTKADEVGYLDRRRTHLYVIDIATKRWTQVTSGDHDDSQPCWSPDGTRLAFTSNRSAEPDRNNNNDIWTVAADNSDKGAHLTQVTTNPGEDNSPTWSPDGQWIAYVTQIEPRIFEYATKHVGVSPASGGPAKLLTLKMDRVTSDPHFSLDSKNIYFIADDDGTQNLCRVSVQGGEVSCPSAGRQMVSAYSVAGNGAIAEQVSFMDRPDEVYFQAADTDKLTRLTHTNDVLLGQLRLAQGEYVHFKSKDGTTVAGYLYKPVDYVPGKKYPTLLRPHGGPVWSFYAEFQMQAQLMAANGYVSLLPNPRGSTGYGQKFSQAIFADWGNKDYQDDMAMVDYAVEKGVADPDKLGVGGHSYGAISTDFIIVQTTRFKAAISDAGEALNISNYGHDQYQKDYETELGRPWENEAVWKKLSPFYRITKVTTPTLFMGGDSDWNVPILGGEQMYQALKSLGRTTELVVYPGEYHEFRTPSHIKDRYQRQLAWYGHYVKGDAAPATPPIASPGEAGGDE